MSVRAIHEIENDINSLEDLEKANKREILGTQSAKNQYILEIERVLANKILENPRAVKVAKRNLWYYIKKITKAITDKI